MVFIKGQKYCIDFTFELFTYMTYGYHLKWIETAYMLEASAKLVLKFFLKHKLNTVQLLNIIGEVDYFIYNAEKLINAPLAYNKTFNVFLCNFLLRHGFYNLTLLKQNIFYKFPINYKALQVKGYTTAFTFHDDYTLVKSSLVYRFNFRIEFESADKLKTILEYLYFFPIWVAKYGIYVRNCYFSYYRL